MPTKAQLAARKAVRTMRAKKEARKQNRWQPTSSRLMDIRVGQKQKRVDRATRAVGKRKKKGKKGKGMPPKVVQYFKNLNSGMSKEAARKAAGLPPAGKAHKRAWGPGHPLWEWQHRKGK